MSHLVPFSSAARLLGALMELGLLQGKDSLLTWLTILDHRTSSKR